MTRRVDVSYKTVIFVTAFFILLWVLFLIRDIILLLFVSFIFMSALAPMVERLVKLKVPRVLAILLIFILVFSILGVLLAVGFTPLIHQTSNLVQRLAENISVLLQSNLIDPSVIQKELSGWSSGLIGFTLNVFENIIRFVSVIVITFYLVLDRGKIEDRAVTLFVGHQERARRLLIIIEDKLGAWLRGQVILSLVIGIMAYLGLVILGVEFALPLAIIAALLEVVPVIGPILSAIPALLIALTVSPLFAVLVGILYLAIQEIEGHVVVPQVMKRAVGLNPLVVILAISIGGRLLGIGGALLAVPIAVVAQVVLQEVLKPAED